LFKNKVKYYKNLSVPTLLAGECTIESLFPFNTFVLKCSNREDLSKIICPYFISITRPISLKAKSPPSKSPKTTTAQKAYKQSF
jgi:hypothetical protein